MNYKYAELNYAKQIYENGLQSIMHMPTELRLVATYMRRVLNYKPRQVKEEMYHWAENNIPSYKKELYYKNINKAITQACKKGTSLINIECIDFYSYEIDYINNLQIYVNEEMNLESPYSNDCKKLLFTLLFKNKVNRYIAKQKNQNVEYEGKYFKGGKRKYSELKKLSHVSAKVKINEDIIYTLWKNNLITPMHQGLIKLDFLDDIYKLQSENSFENTIPVLQIKTFESVGLYFDYYNGNKKIAFCSECGKIFYKKSNRQTYCNQDCSTLADRKKAKSRMQNLRFNTCSF